MLTVLTIFILYNISNSMKIIVTYSFGAFLFVQSSNILHHFYTNTDYNFHIFYFFSNFPVLAVLSPLFSRCFSFFILFVVLCRRFNRPCLQIFVLERWIASYISPCLSNDLASGQVSDGFPSSMMRHVCKLQISLCSIVLEFSLLTLNNNWPK